MITATPDFSTSTRPADTECTLAVGYPHGTWEEMTIHLNVAGATDVNPATDGEEEYADTIERLAREHLNRHFDRTNHITTFITLLHYEPIDPDNE